MFCSILQSTFGCHRCIGIAIAAWLTLAPSFQSIAGTPYEAQLGGFIYAALQTFITGEFAGQGPSNAYANPTMPICKPSDYEDLRAARNDRAAFDAFHKRCHLVEFKQDATYIFLSAYLPTGYCEILKKAFDEMLEKQVFGLIPPGSPGDQNFVAFEYKGSRFGSSGRFLARGAGIKSSCLNDGALRVSAPQKLR